MLIYDCEIIKCIPQKKGRLDPTLEYCSGWQDFKNMGISIIGYALGIDSPPLAIEWGIEAQRQQFIAEVERADCIIGFNSKNFDDNLLAASGVKIQTTYDLLEQIRMIAYGSPRWQDQPRGYSYSLDAIARANGDAKTGSGELAPQIWQQGRKQEVIDYCLHDVKLTQKMLQLGIAGELADPNNGRYLKIPPVNLPSPAIID